MEILLIVAVWALISGCSVQLPVVGSFDNYDEVFKGTVDSYSGSIQVQSLVKKTSCEGVSYLTYVPNPLVRAGRQGKFTLRCADGRIVGGDYVVASPGKGFGAGQDRDGNRFTFAFGLSEPEAEEYIKKELQVASKRPTLPGYRPKETRREKGFSTGTGFFVTGDGYMITSYHVIEDAQEIIITTADRIKLPARFIHGDPANDVALLKVETTTKALPISDSSTLTKGEEVFTLGYPLIVLQGQDQKATFGRVNSLTGIKGDIRSIQIDVPIQPGNSGGPLINTKGQVVGVVTATLNEFIALRASGSLPQNVNYAIKSDYFVPLVRTYLKNKGKEPSVEGQSTNMTELVKRSEPSVVLVIAK